MKTRKNGNGDVLQLELPDIAPVTLPQLWSPYQVWNWSTYLFLTYKIFIPDTIPHPLWPWMLLIYQLWRAQTLYQILVESNNPWPSYGD